MTRIINRKVYYAMPSNICHFSTHHVSLVAKTFLIICINSDMILILRTFS